MVLGIFAQSNQLGAAINALLQAGFSYETGQSIVAVQATERQEQSADLLRQAGGTVVLPD